MRKEDIINYVIERDGNEIELEVTFTGYVEHDDYSSFFEFDEFISAMDEDGNDWVDELTDDEKEDLIEKCEEYILEQDDYERDEYDDYEDDYSDRYDDGDDGYNY